MKLTESQKELILDTFFEAEEVGWKNIANRLIEDGCCIVAGRGCIWNGSIGNYIKTTDAPNAVGCSLYEFDLDNFLTSKYFTDNIKRHLDFLLISKNKIDAEYDEAIGLLSQAAIYFNNK